MDTTGLPDAGSTIASLLIIFLLLGGVAFLLRRFRARLPSAKPQGSINIIANRPLGGQHALVLAEVEGTKILIGVSRNGMTALGRVND